jgi:16S rRNA (guanine527-N7)-methyltransferase
MDDARIAELLTPFLGESPQRRDHEGSASASKVMVLTPFQVRCISIYIDLLVKWNAHINLTAVRKPEEIVTRHFGESIFAARHLFPEERSAGIDPGSRFPVPTPHVIDLGSGAGFPGLPIKIWATRVHVTLIEANQKKATFLREVIRILKLTGADVFSGRAETFPGSQGDVVTLRAVERLELILPVAAGLVGSDGRMAILVGEAQVGRIRKMLPGLQWTEPARLPLSANRVLIIGSQEPNSSTGLADVGLH